MTTTQSLATAVSYNDTKSPDCFSPSLLVGPLLWGVFSVPCACVGVPAGVWLLCVLVQRQRSGLANDVYTLHVTVMDVIFNSTVLPGTLIYFLCGNSTLLPFTVFFYSLNLCGRPLVMVCICVDCYLAVLHPITYMKTRQHRYKQVLCAAIWVLTICFGVLSVHKIGLIVRMLYLIPNTLVAVVTVFCDLAILRALRKPDPSGRGSIHPQKQRAVLAVTNSFVVTVLFYLPLLVVEGLAPLMPLSQLEVQCLVHVPASIGPLLGSAIMPLLHLVHLKSWCTLCGHGGGQC
ncbi:hypothetical protein ACEWY4_026356 [Coilia grayii]|uniref:G-protein coupled receptors family 1 profile domain-containing protein n=1 Tax=Coilia grayii TaxID=363190 RepID=A0ABD1IUN9_9TELE